MGYSLNRKIIRKLMIEMIWVKHDLHTIGPLEGKLWLVDLVRYVSKSMLGCMGIYCLNFKSYPILLWIGMGWKGWWGSGWEWMWEKEKWCEVKIPHNFRFHACVRFMFGPTFKIHLAWQLKKSQTSLYFMRMLAVGCNTLKNNKCISNYYSFGLIKR